MNVLGLHSYQWLRVKQNLRTTYFYICPFLYVNLCQTFDKGPFNLVISDQDMGAKGVL